MAPAKSHSTTLRRKVIDDDGDGDDMPLLIVPILNGETFNLKGPPLGWSHAGAQGPVRSPLNDGLPL